MTFTAEEKLAEIDRELELRRRVYPGWIAKGKLSLRQATRQMDILREVATDYHRAMLEEQHKLNPGSLHDYSQLAEGN